MAAALAHQRHRLPNLFHQGGGMQTSAGARPPSLPTFWLTLLYPNPMLTPRLLHRVRMHPHHLNSQAMKPCMLEQRYSVHLVLQQLRLLVSAPKHW
jgi:hypothetical protein